MFALTATRALRKQTLSTVSRVLAAGAHTKAKLPDLPYDYNALEPVISAEIMTLHHSKHHNAYVTNYNLALEQLDEAVAKNDQTKIIEVSFQDRPLCGDIFTSMQPGMVALCRASGAIRFNLGGHINHSIFWENLASPKNGGGGEPEGELGAAIKAQWGSFENFRNIFNTQTAAVQGSGWGWLGYNPATKQLAITAMPNQDPLQALTGHIPLLGIDVWEHAYYLQYKNMRPDYLKAIWQVVNWKDVSARLAKAKGN